MVGLGYITHADIEGPMGLTLSGTSKPLTDTEVDSLCDLIEDYANGYVIGETRGRTLSDCPNANARNAQLIAMTIKAYGMVQGHRSGVQSESTTDGASATYMIDWGQLRPELRTLAAMASAGGKVMQVVDTLDGTEYHKG